MKQRKSVKSMIRKVAIVLAFTFFLGYFGLMEGITWGAYDHVKGQPSYMVILGCQVKAWGPSDALKDRLNEALAYLADYPDVTIVVSGGQGEDEPSTEAQAMYDYLVEAGIPGEQIWLEEESTNTLENLQYSVALLEEKGCDLTDGVIVVSHGLHLTRVRMLWERVVGDDTYLSTLSADFSVSSARYQTYAREPFALVKSWLMDRL